MPAPTTDDTLAPKTLEPSTLTVLVVDDEEPILQFAEAALELRGFSVLTASCGREAIERSRSFDGEIALFLIDVVMPDCNGPELAEELRQTRPDARVIFTSGYGLGAEKALEQRAKNAIYLRKPFGINQLDQHIQKAMAPEPEA